MNRMELVAAIAEKTELSKKDAEKALKALENHSVVEMYKYSIAFYIKIGTEKNE